MAPRNQPILEHVLVDRERAPSHAAADPSDCSSRTTGCSAATASPATHTKRAGRLAVPSADVQRHVAAARLGAVPDAYAHISRRPEKDAFVGQQPEISRLAAAAQVDVSSMQPQLIACITHPPGTRARAPRGGETMSQGSAQARRMRKGPRHITANTSAAAKQTPPTLQPRRTMLTTASLPKPDPARRGVHRGHCDRLVKVQPLRPVAILRAAEESVVWAEEGGTRHKPATLLNPVPVSSPYTSGDGVGCSAGDGTATEVITDAWVRRALLKPLNASRVAAAHALQTPGGRADATPGAACARRTPPCGPATRSHSSPSSSSPCLEGSEARAVCPRPQTAFDVVALRSSMMQEYVAKSATARKQVQAVARPSAPRACAAEAGALWAHIEGDGDWVNLKSPADALRGWDINCGDAPQSHAQPKAPVGVRAEDRSALSQASLANLDLVVTDELGAPQVLAQTTMSLLSCFAPALPPRPPSATVKPGRQASSTRCVSGHEADQLCGAHCVSGQQELWVASSAHAHRDKLHAAPFEALDCSLSESVDLGERASSLQLE